jgi:hypothetical protein
MRAVDNGISSDFAGLFRALRPGGQSLCEETEKMERVRKSGHLGR